MSLTQQHTIWCDGCVNWDQMTGTARRVLRQMRHLGWRRIKRDNKMIDLCPKCSEKQEVQNERA